jgi:PhnB protein
MANVNFPSDYQRVMPYLIVNNAAGFMDFMKDVFDAKEKVMHKRDGNIVIHGEALIGDSVIMFADANDAWGVCTAGLFIYVPDADTAFINALAAGATSVMPVSDQPYGRSGGVKDPFGNTWWVTTHQ